MAESTFGRRAVNDGKLVQRLREGKRITIDTLNRIEACIASGSPDGAAPVRRPEPIDWDPANEPATDAAVDSQDEAGSWIAH